MGRGSHAVRRPVCLLLGGLRQPIRRRAPRASAQTLEPGEARSSDCWRSNIYGLEEAEGQKALVLELIEGQTRLQINVFTNWFEELTEPVPVP